MCAFPSTIQKNRYLIISVDYEIFGNGSGDVRQHIILPTERMARLCEKYDIPLTVFFEAEEYCSFGQYSKELTKDLGYDPAREMHDQIVDLLRRKHDVQLHLHPEWYGARYEHGTWILRREKQTVDDLFEATIEVVDYIKSRKQILENFVHESSAPCEIVAYRAGAFSAQPSEKLIAALATNRFVLDSSVVKGLTRFNGSVSMDYRDAPSFKNPWRVSNDVAREDSAGAIWEFPIYAVMKNRYKQATWTRLRAKFSSNVPKNKQHEMVRQLEIRKNPLSLLKFMMEPVPVKLDYHNLSPRTLFKWIQSSPSANSNIPDLLMLIGHTKEHVDDTEFERFLKLVKEQPSLKVISLTDAAKMLKESVQNGLFRV